MGGDGLEIVELAELDIIEVACVVTDGMLTEALAETLADMLTLAVEFIACNGDRCG